MKPRSIELTPAQALVGRRLLEGYDSADIAEETGAALATIHKHRAAIVDAVGASTLIQALGICVKRGVLDVELEA